MMVKPYEPPPDYPLEDLPSRFRHEVIYRNPRVEWDDVDVAFHHAHFPLEAAYRSDQLPFPSRDPPYLHPRERRDRRERSVAFAPHLSPRVERDRAPPSPARSRIPQPHPQASPLMLRTRQYPEVAGLLYGEEPAALRRFAKHNASTQRDPPPPSPATAKSKKSLFPGNWTFREKKTQQRPTVVDTLRREGRDDRPLSMNFEMRGAASASARSHPVRYQIPDFRDPRLQRQERVERKEDLYRVPVKVERSATQESAASDKTLRPAPPTQAPPPIPSKPVKYTIAANVCVGSEEVYRPSAHIHSPPCQKPLPLTPDETNRINKSLRQSCPSLDSSIMGEATVVDGMKGRRRTKRRDRKDRWRRTPLEEWQLDDVLLWLQHLQLDETAALLVGYEIRGEDLKQWDDPILARLGVSDPSTREKVLCELRRVQEEGPEQEEKEKERNNNNGTMGRTLFDIVKQSSYDQVLAVETPLTTRDITVTHGRLGCLQVTKVNGANLPLKENDCLLEINERSGELFRSALMLTKLISDSQGQPIRFVVLRRKQRDSIDSDGQDSSSGISSSPRTPVE